MTMEKHRDQEELEQLRLLNLDEWQHECASRFQHSIPGQHVWNGYLFPGGGGFPADYLNEMMTYEIDKDDIIIDTYPKSGVWVGRMIEPDLESKRLGTTWLQEVLWLMYNGVDTEKSAGVAAHERVPFLEEEEMGIPFLDKLESPRMIKTHMPYDLLPQSAYNNGTKMIYCYRNPKDVCTSYYHFYRANPDFGHYTGSWENFIDMFCTGYVSWGSWFDHVAGWLNKKNVLVISFEDLKRDPAEVIKKIAGFCGKKLAEAEVAKIVEFTSFESMKEKKNLYPNVCDHSISHFMRKGEVGDWKRHFTVSQNERLENYMKPKLAGLDIRLVYDEIGRAEERANRNNFMPNIDIFSSMKTFAKNTKLPELPNFMRK